MARRLVNLLTALSLLLCVAVLWVCSYFYYTAVGFWPSPAQRRAYGLVSHHGSLYFINVTEGNGSNRWAWRHNRSRSRESRLVGTAGFTFRRERGQLIIGVPYGLLALLLATPAAARFAMRHRRRVSGHCVACGYNLTGNVSGVCPECGSTSGPGKIGRDDPRRGRAKRCGTTNELGHASRPDCWRGRKAGTANGCPEAG